MADEILSDPGALGGGVELNPADFTILVVDDVAANVMLLKMMLTRERYNVVTCMESPKVRDLCAARRPDLVLQDVMMPVMSGYDVVRQLKADPATRHIPVIFLTAYYDKEHTLEGFASGGSDYVSKPFEKEILLARVNAQLRIASAARVIGERNESLRNTLESRDRMYSVIAHDLRGPLGVVQISLKALADMLPPERIGEDMSGMLNECGKQVGELFALLDNLLKWTKSLTGSLKVVYQDFPASMLTETMEDMYAGIAAMKGVTLSVGPVDTSLSLRSDVDMCKTILRNLLSNAIKFTPRGKAVRLETRREEGFAVLSVSDEGCGLTPEEIGKLFDKETHFTKFGTNREEGSGLGLMICKEFADRLGGRIDITSRPGEGSVFSARIPLAR